MAVMTYREGSRNAFTGRTRQQQQNIDAFKTIKAGRARTASRNRTADFLEKLGESGAGWRSQQRTAGGFGGGASSGIGGSTYVPSEIKPLSTYEGQTGYNSLGYEEAEGSAVRGLEQEFSGAQQREAREAGRYGLSLTSGRARSGRERRALNLALARSGARLEARKGIDELNLQRQTTAREEALKLRSQDITARGQEISAATTRRGQDMSSAGRSGGNPLIGFSDSPSSPRPIGFSSRLGL